MEYDFNKRKNAFMIIGDKLYEGDTHFECMWKALDTVIDEEELDNNFDKYWNMNDDELVKYFGSDDLPKGEIFDYDEKSVIILYDKCDIEKTRKFYDYEIVLYDDMKK